MGKLKVLPGNIANLIAAGEVVQRPASVVKELMENAVDAGAGQVSVIITDSGRTLIQVIDDGCGMSKADAVLCFERHATSKIASAEDLADIITYGFRGEALPSISAVGEITLKTRREKDSTGTQVKVDGINSIKASECACPQGSNFSVRNLFYNTPARRKFLKSDNIEFKHIVEEFSRVALSHPDTGFSLTHNGRAIYTLKKAKSLKFRIQDLCGASIADGLVDVDIHTSLLHLGGFVGRPDAARKTPGNQYFFLNGRFFRSAYLHKAVMKAYEEFVPEGTIPPYFLFLATDPHSVDVNIHPTKTEIKFEDEALVFQTIYAGIKGTLGENSFSASIDFDTEGAVPLPQLGRSFEEYHAGIAKAPVPETDPGFDPFADAGKSFEFQGGSYGGGHKGPTAQPVEQNWGSRPVEQNWGGRPAERSQDYGKLFEDRMLPASRAMVLQGKYILTPVKSGLMVISIRRALERILFDRALAALGKEAHVTQTALFPTRIQVGVQNRLLLEDNAGMLSQLGFDISAEGNDSVVVNGVPEGYSCQSGKIEQIVSDLCLILSEGTTGVKELMQAQMAQKFAVLGASHAENVSSPQEAQRIIDTLFASSNSELTSDGRRIAVIIPTEEIDRKF